MATKNKDANPTVTIETAQTPVPSAIDRARRTGQSLLASEQDNVKLDMAFALDAAVAILSAHKKLISRCEEEGVTRRIKSSRKYIREIDYLCGRQNQKESDALPADAIARLDARIGYVALQTEALIWLAKKEKLKLTGDENDANALAAKRDAVGVRKLLEDYKASKRKPRATGGSNKNVIVSTADILNSVAAAYASREPRATVELPHVVGEANALKIVLATKVNDKTLHLHEALEIPRSAIRSVLTQTSNLPIGDLDPSLNLFCDVLLVGSIACPDHKHTLIEYEELEEMRERTIETLCDNFRQFLVRPAADELWVSYRYTPSHVAVRVSGIAKFPALPTVDAYFFTKHRLELDALVNRFDRQRFCVDAAPAEVGAKWVSKVSYAMNSKEVSYPLHLHDAEGHAVDVLIPNPSGINYETSMTIDPLALQELWSSHVADYITDKNQEKHPVVTFGVKERNVALKFGGLGQTKLKAALDKPVEKLLTAYLRGEDFARIVDAINHLDCVGDIRVSIDPNGVIQFAVKTETAQYEFFAPTTPSEKNSEPRDGCYVSARELFYTEPETQASAA